MKARARFAVSEVLLFSSCSAALLSLSLVCTHFGGKIERACPAAKRRSGVQPAGLFGEGMGMLPCRLPNSLQPGISALKFLDLSQKSTGRPSSAKKAAGDQKQQQIWKKVPAAILNSPDAKKGPQERMRNFSVSPAAPGAFHVPGNPGYGGTRRYERRTQEQRCGRETCGVRKSNSTRYVRRT